MQTYGSQEMHSQDPLDKRQYLNVDLKTIALTNREGDDGYVVTDRNDEVVHTIENINQPSPYEKHMYR